MTDAAGLNESLAGMGFVEMGLAIGALGCYSLALSGSFSAGVRTAAAGCAAVAAGAFTALADPWVNGVILAAIGICGIGLFVALAWALSAACGLTARRVAAPVPAEPQEVAQETPPESAAPVLRARPRTPAHSS